MLVALSLAFGRPPQQVGPYDPGRSFAPLVEAVAPAVVLVRTRTEAGEGEHSGSGFVIDPEGLVLTANHVVQDVDALWVVSHDGTTHTATIIGADAAMDIALLKVETAQPWPWLALETTPPRVGDRVLALGNPLGLGATVTAGIVSGTDRDLQLDPYWKSDRFIQTDAAINQGNSGGPLVDLDGKVLGMNTSIIAGANTVGFAIPAQQLAEALPQLREHGRILRGFLGVDSNKITAEAAERYGLEGGTLIVRVLPGSPAADAGLRRGDLIVRVDDEPVTSGAELLALIGTHKPGDVVRITLIRKKDRRTVEVTLAPRPAE